MIGGSLLCDLEKCMYKQKCIYVKENESALMRTTSLEFSSDLNRIA